MRFDLTKCTWSAIHENKTVYQPNYTDINRDTLLEFKLQDENHNEIFTLKKENDRLNLFARLRTSGMSLNNSGVKHWIIGNADPLKFYIINSDGDITEYTEWGSIPSHKVEFMEGEKCGYQ